MKKKKYSHKKFTDELRVLISKHAKIAKVDFEVLAMFTFQFIGFQLAEIYDVDKVQILLNDVFEEIEQDTNETDKELQ